MAANDLARLYSAKKTLENYHAVERQNSAVFDKQSAETTPVRKAAEARVAVLEKKIAKCKANSFFARKGFWILFAGALLIALLIVGSRTVFSSFVSPDLGTVADRYEEHCLEDDSSEGSGFPGLDGILGGHEKPENSANKTKAANETAKLCFGNIILITLVTGFIFLVAYFMQFEEKDKKSDEGSTPLIGFFFLFALLSVAIAFALPYIGRTVWGLTPTIGTLSLFFGGLLAAVTGIGKIFTVTYSFALFVLILDVLFYGTLTVFFVKRVKFTFNANTNKKAVKLKEQIAAIRKESEATCKAIHEKYLSKFKANPYEAAYNRLPAYQRDYGTVTALIWAIENGYASDIPSARNYWDCKAQDAAVQRQLQQIQATSEAALSAAQAAKIAAEAPVDVNVTIYH